MSTKTSFQTIYEFSVEIGGCSNKVITFTFDTCEDAEHERTSIYNAFKIAIDNVCKCIEIRNCICFLNNITYVDVSPIKEVLKVVQDD